MGWLVNQFEVFGKIRNILRPSTTYATPDEITCLNERVLKLAGENGQAAAEQRRAKFLDDYKGLVMSIIAASRFGRTTSMSFATLRTPVNGWL
jgi:hypothetical protein